MTAGADQYVLPSDLVLWKIIRRNGCVFAASVRYGGSLVFEDTPEGLRHVITSARKQQQYVQYRIAKEEAEKQ